MKWDIWLAVGILAGIFLERLLVGLERRCQQLTCSHRWMHLDDYYGCGRCHKPYHHQPQTPDGT